MVKLLIRRGVVTDLARVPHSLDLSSPYMAATVNATLKPLETLSRAVNIPPQAPPAAVKNKAGGDSAGPIIQEDHGTTTTHTVVNNTGLFEHHFLFYSIVIVYQCLSLSYLLQVHL